MCKTGLGSSLVSWGKKPVHCFWHNQGFTNPALEDPSPAGFSALPAGKRFLRKRGVPGESVAFLVGQKPNKPSCLFAGWGMRKKADERCIFRCLPNLWPFLDFGPALSYPVRYHMYCHDNNPKPIEAKALAVEAEGPVAPWNYHIDWSKYKHTSGSKVAPAWAWSLKVDSLTPFYYLPPGCLMTYKRKRAKWPNGRSNQPSQVGTGWRPLLPCKCLQMQLGLPSSLCRPIQRGGVDVILPLPPFKGMSWQWKGHNRGGCFSESGDEL